MEPTLYPDIAGEGGCSCFGCTTLIFLVRVLVGMEAVLRVYGWYAGTVGGVLMWSFPV